MVKVDFEKTYGSVAWGFLDYMLGGMGFSEKWIRWIHSCFHNSTILVLVNGSPIGDFRMHNGHKQGDPLSRFLLLMVAEGLTGMVQNTVWNDMLSILQVNYSLNFSLL